MSGNESQNGLDEFVLIVTIPDSAADRIMQLLLNARHRARRGRSPRRNRYDGPTQAPGRREKNHCEGRGGTRLSVTFARIANHRRQRTPAGALCLQSTPVGRGRCCGALGT